MQKIEKNFYPRATNPFLYNINPSSGSTNTATPAAHATTISIILEVFGSWPGGAPDSGEWMPGARGRLGTGAPDGGLNGDGLGAGGVGARVPQAYFDEPLARGQKRRQCIDNSRKGVLT